MTTGKNRRMLTEGGITWAESPWHALVGLRLNMDAMPGKCTSSFEFEGND